MNFDIKAAPFKYCTLSVCRAECCDSLSQSRGDSFPVQCVYTLLQRILNFMNETHYKEKDKDNLMVINNFKSKVKLGAHWKIYKNNQWSIISLHITQ